MGLTEEYLVLWDRVASKLGSDTKAMVETAVAGRHIPLEDVQRVKKAHLEALSLQTELRALLHEHRRLAALPAPRPRPDAPEALAAAAPTPAQAARARQAAHEDRVSSLVQGLVAHVAPDHPAHPELRQIMYDQVYGRP